MVLLMLTCHLQVSKGEENCQADADIDDETTFTIVDSDNHQEGISYNEILFCGILFLFIVFVS